MSKKVLKIESVDMAVNLQANPEDLKRVMVLTFSREPTQLEGRGIIAILEGALK